MQIYMYLIQICVNIHTWYTTLGEGLYNCCKTNAN